MTYVYWLLGISAAFVLFERLRPRRRQRLLRKGVATDLVYLVFNGHFLGVALVAASAPLIELLDATLAELGWRDAVYLGAAASLPAWAQLTIAFVLVDLLHYWIHRAIHRVPALWAFHKVHHSIETMDWLGNLRFHWAEGVVYKSLTYPLLAFFGFHGEVLFALAVVTTVAGHFNHSNVNLSLGPLRYVVNNPAMHLWHHAFLSSPATTRNFGLTLCVWDFVFGTAYLPSHAPERLGFEGIEAFPKTVAGQLAYPFPLERGALRLIRSMRGRRAKAAPVARDGTEQDPRSRRGGDR